VRKILEKNEDSDFFFWLGEDALTSVTQKEFQSKINQYRKIVNDHYDCPKPTE
jgi:hypothetical protein